MDWIGLTLKIIYHIIRYWSDPDRMEAAVRKDILDSRYARLHKTKGSLDENEDKKLRQAYADLDRELLNRELQNRSKN